MVLSVNVVANECSVAQIKGLAWLLINRQTFAERYCSVTFRELIGIRVGLDCGFELFGTRAVLLFDAVLVVRLGSAAGRRFFDSDKAVPGNSITASGVQNTPINACFIEPGTNVIPCNCRDGENSFLELAG